MPEPVPRVLVVDDEPNICKSCVRILAKLKLETATAQDGYEALALMEESAFDLVITDLKMARMGGMQVVRRIKETDPDTPVIVMTGYASVASAVEVMKLGAVDYLPKPFTPEELRAVVSQSLSDLERLRQNRRLAGEGKPGRSVSHQLVGESPKIKKVISMVRKVAPTEATVCVYGESGTGKELIARSVHANSSRKDRVFFAVDCGTLSGNLLESELFGYARGAFTGAMKDKQGIFRLADGGTVFLDEISNISLEVQGKLLRFLETQEFLPLGSTQHQRVDVRLIFATNRNLETMVAEGSFREDFYYRIYVYPIILPALRERRGDILPIAYHFLTRFARDVGKSIQGFDETAARRLSEFDWPGNVRQLRNNVERLMILAGGDADAVITADMLPQDVGAMVPAMPKGGGEQLMGMPLREAREAFEREYLRAQISRFGGNISRTAEFVGMERSALHRKLKALGMD